MANLRAALAQFGGEGLRVFHPDPRPRAAMALIVFAQEEMAAIARDGSKAFIAPIVPEAKGVHVIFDAGPPVCYRQDRLGAAQRVRHRSSSGLFRRRQRTRR
jgi:hypothetical protein